MRLLRKRVIIAGLFSARDPEAHAAMHALAAHVERLGGILVGQILQRRGVSRDNRPGGAKRMHQPLSGATLIGRGKAKELAALCHDTCAELVIFQNPLSERQRQNLETLCNARVHDAYSLRLDE